MATAGTIPVPNAHSISEQPDLPDGSVIVLFARAGYLEHVGVFTVHRVDGELGLRMLAPCQQWPRYVVMWSDLTAGIWWPHHAYMEQMYLKMHLIRPWSTP